MTVCEYCEEVLGSEKDCHNCYYGNPCYGCEHDKNANNDCTGQCAGSLINKEEHNDGSN